MKPLLKNYYLNRRTALKTVLGASLLGAGQFASAQAAWKPANVVKLVVGFPPGGPTDVLARIIAGVMNERGIKAIVENRPGASGSIAAEYVYRSVADGTTLLIGASDTISVYPALYKARFEPGKFLPIAALGGIPLYLIGRQDLPASNLNELIALAKKVSLSYASSGNGSVLHLGGEAFARSIKVDTMLHVPFQGGVPQVQAILGKQVDIAVTTGGLSLPQRDRIKVFAGSGPTRHPALPDVPTFIEQGVPLEIVSWSGVLAPPGTPDAIIGTLAKLISEITASPAYQTSLTSLVMTPYNLTQPEFAKLVERENLRWGEIVKAAKIKID